MKPTKASGFSRLIKATRYSIAGFKAAWQNEAAFRQECGLLLIAIPLAWWLGNTGLDRVLLIGSVLSVMIVELINSAIEAVVDRIGAEIHPLSARAKDLGSAAVLLSLIWAIIIWIIFLLTKFN
ncbi:MAG: hypothetical protein RL637_1226 [Pseudomonadota bacterium]|jgi:diacylglycerol kinase (ATP)